jgi:lipopolysaccharide transport system ATP-binding protein
MPNDIALKIENLSKKYRLGLVGTNTLRGDLQAWWYRMRGKEDPTLKIGEENKLAESGGKHIWALQDINLEVKKGEVLGIIGKNGAGKSTLLKILSRVTGPTTGKVEINGSIASLLEVGTGFHPELTGMENIYLNGAIMGMSKAEIKSKIDEIVEFAGVAKYIDTPVKRYSSGMRVRLGFAVAAFLEPDILVVDEVLAVGDAEFQKKAIGKMKDVSKGEGRTVLFVSHNMGSVKALCTRAVLLENGRIAKIGGVDNIVSYYLSGGGKNTAQHKNFEPENFGNKSLYISEIGIHAKGKSPAEPLARNNVLEIFIKYNYEKTDNSFYHINLRVKSDDGVYLFNTANTIAKNKIEISEGNNTFKVIIPDMFLKDGNYLLDCMIVKNRKNVINIEDDVLAFSINPEKKALGSNTGKGKTYLTPHIEWLNV